MAKKSRTPPPPRKVQAPKQRAAAREGLSDQTKRRILYGIAAAGVAGVAVAIAIIAVGGGGGGKASDTGVAQALRAAGCTYKVYPATSQKHVTSLTAKVKYNSFPPSNGAHYYQPALWGNYTDPVAQVQAVHNLEHGAMVIEYGNEVPAREINQISTFYSDSPNGMLVFPYAPLGKRIAFVAWTADLKRLGSNREGGYHGEGRVALCARFDAKAAEAFQKAFRGKGPERFPVRVLQPGT